MSMPALGQQDAAASRLSGFAIRDEPDRWDWLIFICLAVAVYSLRQAFAGPVYFVDGPLILASILGKSFIIQSPGYWVYAHLGGLFADPAAGLAFWNKLFSALGGAVFFVFARLLGTKRLLALLAALTYSCTYYIWFSGEIHSSYAAEILFPVLTLCCFLKLQQRRTVLWSLFAALSSGLAIALRPSDGIFLLPLWAYLLWHGRYRWKGIAMFTAVSLFVFLSWYLPTRQAAHRVGASGTESQLMVCLRTTSVFLVGVTPRSIANVSRVYLPLLLAWWPLLPLMFCRRDASVNKVLALWSIPGLLFFTVGYVADPTYLVFLSGAFVLAAVLQKHIRRAIVCLCVCLVWNAAIFMAARPIACKSDAALVWNYYLAKYCAYGIKHQWTATIGQTGSANKVY